MLASGQAAKQMGELKQAWLAFVSRLSKEVQGSTHALLRHCACALVACGLYNCQTLDTLIKCGPALPHRLLPSVRHSLVTWHAAPRAVVRRPPVVCRPARCPACPCRAVQEGQHACPAARGRGAASAQRGSASAMLVRIMELRPGGGGRVGRGRRTAATGPGSAGRG